MSSGSESQLRFDIFLVDEARVGLMVIVTMSQIEIAVGGFTHKMEIALRQSTSDCSAGQTQALQKHDTGDAEIAGTESMLGTGVENDLAAVLLGFFHRNLRHAGGSQRVKNGSVRRFASPVDAVKLHKDDVPAVFLGQLNLSDHSAEDGTAAGPVVLHVNNEQGGVAGICEDVPPDEQFHADVEHGEECHRCNLIVREHQVDHDFSFHMAVTGNTRDRASLSVVIGRNCA